MRGDASVLARDENIAGDTMATFDGTAGNDSFAGSGADDVFNFGDATFNGGTLVAGRGNDTISGGGGFDRLVFGNIGIDYLDPSRVGDDLLLGLRPTPGDDVDPALGGLTIVGFYLADGSGLIDRIDFADAYILCTMTAGVFRAEHYTAAGVLYEVNTLGTAAAESFTGTALTNRIEGGGGNDTLSGLGGDDGLDGEAGDDSLLGGDGNDTLWGSTGNDTLIGGSGDDSLEGSIGIDTADYSFANGRIVIDLSQTYAKDGFGAPGASTNVGTDVLLGIERVIGGNFGSGITGDDGANTLIGGAGSDGFAGLAGNDSLVGGGGMDTMHGGAAAFGTVGQGNDTLDGGTITDLINYIDGNFLSYSAAGAGVVVNLQTGTASDGFGGTDTLRNLNLVGGSSLNDTLTGSNRLLFERFIGGAGNDVIDGGAITDKLNTNNTNLADFNTLAAAVNVDLLAGTAVGQGNDTLININQVQGSVANDTLSGSNRTDVFESFSGLAGNDALDGRGGLDRASYQYAANGVSVNLATGSGFVSATDQDTLTSIEGIRASNFNDTLTGGAAANSALEFFLGNGGNDLIDGGSGYDRVDYFNAMLAVTVTLGGASDGTASDGTPVLNGQIVYAGTAGATIGTDTLRNIEAVRGSDFDDTLTGSAIATQETFEGRKGNDSIDGGAGLDRVGYDQAIAGVTVALGASGAAGTAADGWGDTDTLRGIENVQGSRDFADRITGNELSNVLDGQGGNDTLIGAAGNDTLDGGAGADSMVGGNGSDTYGVDSLTDIVGEAGTVSSTADLVTSLVSWSLNKTGNFLVEKLTLGGSAASGTGNALANTIAGNAAANALAGGTGNDTLRGDAGNDTLTGGTGNDSMVGGNGNDTYGVDSLTDIVGETGTVSSTQDLVTSSVSWSLNKAGNLLVEKLTLTGTAASGTGNTAANTILGNGGANTLNGLAGNDILTGGLGGDTFAFTTALNATTNADRITDFNVVADRIQLENAIFAKLAVGAVLNAANFRASLTGTAVDTNDYILYDTNGGQLYYDADGSGAGARVLFATLTGLPALTAADLFVV